MKVDTSEDLYRWPSRYTLDLSMETVKVSTKYQVVIPEKLRQEAGIKPGDKMVAIAKHGILQYVPVHPLGKMKGSIPGLDTKDFRDETDRF